MQRLEVQHIIAAAVAAGLVALAMAGGGFEPTAYAAAGLILWVGSVAGLALGVLPRSEPPGSAILAGLSLAGLAALMALSLLWGDDAGHGFEDVVRALAYLGGFVLVVLASRRGGARPWLVGLAIALALVAAIALLGRFEPSWFGNPDAGLARDLPSYLGRLTYPIGYWNGLAAAMAAGIVLLSWLATVVASRWGRAIAVSALPVVLLALWMTDSRGGIVAALIGVGVLLLAGRRRARLVAELGIGLVGGAVLVVFAEGRDALLDDPLSGPAAAQGDQMLAIAIVVVAATLLGRYAADRPVAELRVSPMLGRIAVGLAVVAAVVAVIAIDPSDSWDQFKQPPQPEDVASGDVGLLRGGGSGRYQFWTAAVDGFASKPVTGLGAAGYTPYWFEHRDVAISATRAHSLVFETLAELGIVGLALLVGFAGSAVTAGVRRVRAPGAVAEAAPALAVLVVEVASAGVDWTWDLPAVFGIAVLTAALLTGPATLAGADPGPPRRGAVRNRRRFAAGIVVLLVAWVSICACGLLMLSDHSLASSRDAYERGDASAAVEAANDAIDLQPWAAEPQLELALGYELGDDLPAARDAIAEAIDRAPDDYRLRLVAARIDRRAHDLAAARAQLLEAKRLNPQDPAIQRQLQAALSS